MRSAMIGVCALYTACMGGDGAPQPPVVAGAIVSAPPAVVTRAPDRSALVVDSARPMAALIANFQRGPAVEQLANAEASGEGLSRALIAAIDRHDTTAIARMFIARAEFAHIYFPSSRLARPPYEIDPALAWFQLSAESEKGVRKALDRLGGRGIAFRGLSCAAPPVEDGRVRIWRGCRVRVLDRNGHELDAALFDAMLEYRGRFKFLSYANRL